MPQESHVNYDVFGALNRHGLNPPEMLTFSITGACNLTCTHCWVEAETTSPVMNVPEDTIRRILREFRGMGGDGIRFTGGEPLLHPAWLDLLRFAKELGFRTVATQTNAILINDHHISVMRDLDLPEFVLQISLDGARAATHDRVRGAGAFDGALEGIRRLADGGLAGRISIFSTEMRHNLEEVPDLLELADSFDIRSVATGALVLCGRAGNDTLVAPPLPEQYFALLHRYENDKRFRDLYEKICKTAAIEWLKGDSPRQESCTFVENPYLSFSGSLYPCVLCHTEEFSVPRVFEMSFAQAMVEGAKLWSSLKNISSSRAAFLEECRDCPGDASCAGGCMGRAWGSCGDFMAPDDRCDLRRAIYTRKANGEATG